MAIYSRQCMFCANTFLTGSEHVSTCSACRKKKPKEIMTRVCSICQERKELNLFTPKKGSSRGYGYRCKECTSLKKKEQYQKVKEYDNNILNKRRSKNSMLKKKYGITLAQYDAMYTAQGGKCAACGRVFPTLCIDHNHITGKVRALLCNPCNTTYGMLLEDPTLIESLLQYALRWHTYVLLNERCSHII